MNKTAERLQHVVENSQDVLAEATTVFPFTFFPDTLRIDREKLTIVHRTFFSVAQVMSIHIDDVLNVTANAGPFFGSLEISTRFFANDKPFRITYFWRDDALRLKAIIQGYIIARQEDLKTDKVSSKELVEMLTQLGETDTNSPGA